MLEKKITEKQIAVIVQGPSTHVQEQREAWKGYPHIIYSTWEGDENQYFEQEVVIFTEKPSEGGSGNINLQKTTTIKGLELAKHLGYQQVLKIRSDIVPTNWLLFLDLLKVNKLNFLCWHINSIQNYPQYLVDYLMAGSIDDLTTLWKSCESTHPVAEGCLMDSFNKHFKIDCLEMFLNKLTHSNDLNWLKYGKRLSSYNEHDCYIVN
jgi:hypothetical protein